MYFKIKYVLCLNTGIYVKNVSCNGNSAFNFVKIFRSLLNTFEGIPKFFTKQLETSILLNIVTKVREPPGKLLLAAVLVPTRSLLSRHSTGTGLWALM